MLTVRNRTTVNLKVLAAALLALASLAGFFAAASARAAGPGRIVFVSGKAERCRMGACNRFDVIRSVTPHGAGAKRLALVSSVVETASTESGTIAVLSKNVAGGGANSEAYTQVYLITPDGKRKQVFRERLEGFKATGLGISGNGKLLAISARYGQLEDRRSKIWLVRSDGSGFRQLTSGPGNDEMPALSPDGKRVVFSRTVGESRRPDLYTVPTSGGEAVRMTENDFEDVNPVISPDGRSVAFGQYNHRTNRGILAVLRIGQHGPRVVTSTGGEYPDPDYSPNGRNLAFVSEVLGARGYDTALYTVRASGGGRTLVSGAFEYSELPQWTLRP
jgi:Tol biopolymer transport system component